MQETVKLITSSELKKGQVISLPNVGDITFSPEGVIEVPAEEAQQLVDLFEDFSFFEKSDEPVKTEEIIKPQTQEEDLNKSNDEDKLNPQTEENDITGSTEPVIVQTEEVQDEIPEESAEATSDTSATVDPAEVKSKLEEKTFDELKELVAKFDTELSVKSKKAAIEFLLTKLV